MDENAAGCTTAYHSQYAEKPRQRDHPKIIQGEIHLVRKVRMTLNFPSEFQVSTEKKLKLPTQILNLVKLIFTGKVFKVKLFPTNN